MRIWLALAAAYLVSTAAPALASDHDRWSGAPLPPDKKNPIPSPITDHFYIKALFYDPAVSTNLRVDAKNAGPGVFGTPVNAERDLGLDARVPMGSIELMVRLKERSKLRFDFLVLNRQDGHTITQPITFGDQTFASNSFLQSTVNWHDFGLTYTYSFWKSDWLEIGAGLGVHFVEAQARGLVPATQPGQIAQRQEVSGSGGFPTVALDLTYRISRRWALTAWGDYLHATFSNFDGWVANYHEDVQYRWKDNFTIGLGYTSRRTSLELSSGHFPGEFKISLEGPEAFFRVSF